MLQVRHLTKQFDAFVAVGDLSFDLGRGEVCGFVGPNGAGKTTTMRMIATLEEPTSGGAWIEGTSIHDDPYRVRRLIGFMPDHYGSYPALTVRDYLEFYARAYELDRSTRGRRIAQIMDFTGLEPLAAKQVETLSKGMRQRLNLGRALLNDPRVLIMDEPAAGLDPRARIELRYLIRNLADLGKTIFVSSHILTELNEMCDTLLIIDRGKAITFGHFDDLQRGMQEQTRIEIRLFADGDLAGLERMLLQRPRVAEIHPGEGNTLQLNFLGEAHELPLLLRDIVTEGFPVIEFRPQTLTMEDIFMRITEREGAGLAQDNGGNPA